MVTIKCYMQGLNSCPFAEGAYFISTVVQTGHAFSWCEKSSNRFHRIMKMAVMWTFCAKFHAEKKGIQIAMPVWKTEMWVA